MESIVTFSILCPVYNVERFILSSIESVLQQTFTDWELILVDDGSTDSSGKICDEYKNKYPNKIRVYHKNNQGLLHTRRYALSKATGKYYVFLDSDDFFSCNALEILYQKFQQYQCDCIIYGIVTITPEGKKLNVLASDVENYLVDKKLLYRKILLNHDYNSLCRKAIKASIVDAFSVCYDSFYHIQYGEDLLQTLEILHNCTNCLFIPQVLYYYTQNPTSIIHSSSLLSIYNFFEVRQCVLDFVTTEQVFNHKDFNDFHQYNVILFEKTIKNICRMSLPIDEQVKIMREIKKNFYCQSFIMSSQYKQPFRIIYTQFLFGLYFLLIIEIKIYTYIKKLLIKYRKKC